MITITRNLARQVRSVFRRALAITPRSLSRPVALEAGPEGLSIRAKGFDGAAEYRVSGEYPREKLILPFEFLDDCEGKKDEPVELSAGGDGRVAVQWRDKAVPQIVQYDAPAAPDPDEFPAMPDEMAGNPVSLLAALHAADETTDPAPTRFAVDHLQLQGRTGRVHATDGRQLLVQGGFRFPWQEDVLLPRSRVFASQELLACESVRIGRTESWLALAAGPWTIHLRIDCEGRFPEVEGQIADPAATTSRFRLSEADAAFLAHALPRLPSEDEFHHPVTLDLNGQVAVRARAPGQAPTELVLAGSSCSGEAVRLNTNRAYLARAIRLGFRELEVVSCKSPVVCRDEERAYVWALLEPEAAIGPHKDALRIEPPDGEALAAVPQPVKPRRTRSMSPTTSNTNTNTSTNMSAPPNGEAGPQGEAAPNAKAASNGRARQAQRHKAQVQDVASLIEQAEAFRAAARDLADNASQLVKALKQHRRQSRIVASTIESLKQLRALGV